MNLHCCTLLLTNASRLTKFEFGPRKLSGVRRTKLLLSLAFKGSFNTKNLNEYFVKK